MGEIAGGERRGRGRGCHPMPPDACPCIPTPPEWLPALERQAKHVHILLCPDDTFFVQSPADTGGAAVVARWRNVRAVVTGVVWVERGRCNAGWWH